MKSAEIIRAVCDELEVTVANVLSQRLWPELVEARRRITAQLRDKGCSYPRIGRVLKRHHSTVQTLVKGKRRPCVAEDRNAS